MKNERTRRDAKAQLSAFERSEMAGSPPDLEERVKRIRVLSQRLVDEVAKVIVGKRDVLENVTVAILADGSHLLFEDMPGLGKSVMCAAFSHASGCDFRRVQFTPDLLPGDITGTSIYNQRENQFEFKPGPIFTNFLLADEINRASPKTQSALLEAMAEKQVSVEGTTHQLGKPFLVMATQNPVEQEGTYPLPEAQMDRFAMRMSMGYPTEDDEVEILKRRVLRREDGHTVDAACSPKILTGMQRSVEYVHVSEDIFRYISRIITGTRRHAALKAGASPRGSLNILKLSRSWAAMNGRVYVTPDDVKRLAVPVLAHRVILEPDVRLSGVSPESVIEEIVDQVVVPKV